MSLYKRYIPCRLFGSYMENNNIGNIDGFNWFIDKYNVNKIYSSPILNRGKEVPLSVKKIHTECEPFNRKVSYDILFNHPLILRDTDKKISYLTLHSGVEPLTTLEIINEWEEFKYYLHKYNLILTIYSDPKKAFLLKQAQTLIVINRKGLEYLEYEPSEIIRYYNDGNGSVERYIITFQIKNIPSCTRIVARNKFVPTFVDPNIHNLFNQRISHECNDSLS